MTLEITKASMDDFDNGIWDIFKKVISRGDSFIYDPTTTKEEGFNIWMTSDTAWMPNVATYVAKVDGKIIGSYVIRQNRIGLGSHVCNAAYIVDEKCRGNGYGEALCRHSLEEAKRLGFHSMQFNMVVSTNHKAAALWMKMGFEVVGTVPCAFNHKKKGLVDAYIMHRFL